MTYKSTFAALCAATALSFASAPAIAGGFEEPVVAVQPVIVAPVAVVPSSDWSGFYLGGQVGGGSVDNDLLDDDTTGAVYGVHAGYQYDFGSVVLGGELDYDATNIESDAPVDGVEVDAITRAKLRLGYDAGQWMPYITAGAVNAETSGDVDGDGQGAFAGLGLSYLLNDTWMIGGEVLQHAFEDFDDTDDLDIDATTATLRVSYKF